MHLTDKVRKDPTFRIGAMIVALTILNGVGFVFLYAMSELNTQRISNEIGIIREMMQQKKRLEKRKAIDQNKSQECVNVGDRVCTTAEEAPYTIITLDIQPEDACRAGTKCERQEDGKCGWTRTPEFEACLKNPPPASFYR